MVNRMKFNIGYSIIYSTVFMQINLHQRAAAGRELIR